MSVGQDGVGSRINANAHELKPHPSSIWCNLKDGRLVDVKPAGKLWLKLEGKRCTVKQLCAMTVNLHDRRSCAGQELSYWRSVRHVH